MPTGGMGRYLDRMTFNAYRGQIHPNAAQKGGHGVDLLIYVLCKYMN